MNAYRTTSPLGGPDMAVHMPTKPVRLTLNPQEALALYVTLENCIEVLQKGSTKPPADLVGLLLEVHGKLFDRMEVVWEKPTPSERGK